MRPVLAALLLIAGCGGARARTSDATPLALRDQAAQDLHCPADALSAEPLGRGEHRVDGCGEWIRYTCLARDGEIGCHWIERGVSRSRSTWGDAIVGEVRVRLHDRLAACLPPGRDEAEIRVTLTVDGHVRRAGPADESSACVEAVLRTERLPGYARRERAVTWVVIASEHADEAEPEPGIEASPGDRARRLVDQLRPHLARCTAGEPITIQLSWSADGRLDALASGISAEREQCVRSIVQRARIAPPGRPGFVSHVLTP